jgi:hypothetical protein
MIVCVVRAIGLKNAQLLIYVETMISTVYRYSNTTDMQMSTMHGHKISSTESDQLDVEDQFRVRWNKTGKPYYDNVHTHAHILAKKVA